MVQRMALINRTQMEMHELEGREMDLMGEADTIDRSVSRMATVLQFQSEIDTQMRLDEEEKVAMQNKILPMMKGRKRNVMMTMTTTRIDYDDA